MCIRDSSSKDRIALHIVESAEKKGILKPGDTIIETTSGNTGFSLAMVSLIKGYKCILAVSSKSSTDKIDMLKAMGAKVYVCPANVSADDPRSYYEVAKRLHSEIKGSIYINQYFNDLNADAHYSSTGPEIWNQTDGNITHLIVCSGTGGTISGTARYLKEKNPNPKTELEYSSVFTLLVAVVLSAQSTDKGVNSVTRKLFKEANTPQKMVELGEKKIKKLIARGNPRFVSFRSVQFSSVTFSFVKLS